MRRKKSIDPAKRAWWSVHVEAWLASRLSRRDYCKAHSLNRGTMGVWVKRLAPQAMKIKPKRPRVKAHNPYSRAGRMKAVQGFWAMHVEAMQWSGCSAAGYARAHNLCAATLREWRIRLEDHTEEINWREMVHPAARPRIGRGTSSAAKPQAADLSLTRPPEPVRQAAPRRTFSEAEKQAIVAESEASGASAAEVCRRHCIASSMLFRSLLRKVLDVRFGGPTEVDDATTQEGDDVTSATAGFYVFAERLVGVFGLIGLSPFDLRGDTGSVENCSDTFGRRRSIVHHTLAVRKKIGRRVAAIVDDIAFESQTRQRADNLGEAHRVLICCVETLARRCGQSVIHSMLLKLCGV